MCVGHNDGQEFQLGESTLPSMSSIIGRFSAGKESEWQTCVELNNHHWSLPARLSKTSPVLYNMLLSDCYPALTCAAGQHNNSSWHRHLHFDCSSNTSGHHIILPPWTRPWRLNEWGAASCWFCNRWNDPCLSSALLSDSCLSATTHLPWGLIQWDFCFSEDLWLFMHDGVQSFQYALE